MPDHRALRSGRGAGTAPPPPDQGRWPDGRPARQGAPHSRTECRRLTKATRHLARRTDLLTRGNKRAAVPNQRQDRHGPPTPGVSREPVVAAAYPALGRRALRPSRCLPRPRSLSRFQRRRSSICRRSRFSTSPISAWNSRSINRAFPRRGPMKRSRPQPTWPCGCATPNSVCRRYREPFSQQRTPRVRSHRGPAWHRRDVPVDVVLRRCVAVALTPEQQVGAVGCPHRGLGHVEASRHPRRRSVHRRGHVEADTWRFRDPVGDHFPSGEKRGEKPRLTRSRSSPPSVEMT